MRRRFFNPRSSILYPLCAAFLGVAALGCDRGSLGLDMYTQPKKRAYESSEFFKDGSSSRPLVAGTVPRDTSMPGFPDRASHLITPMAYAQVPPTGGFPPGFPTEGEKLREVLEQGQKVYNINCSMCHGLSGQGDGMIVQRGFTPPPSFVLLESDRETNPYRYQREQYLQTAAPGHIYNAITNGFGAMYSYAERVSPSDRWAVAAYVKLLQQAKPDPTMAQPPTSTQPAPSPGGAQGPAAEKRQP